MRYNISEARSSLLLKRFNGRDGVAYGEVYALFYDELLHFSMKFYRDTEIEPSDVVHDIFVKIWESKSLMFNDLYDIKAYIYVSIKNSFRNYLDHKRCTDKYKEAILSNKEFFTVEVAEGEVYSLVREAVNLLPADCAKVMNYLLEGWNVREIASELNRPERTIYNKKLESISLLKGKIPKEILLIVISSIR